MNYKLHYELLIERARNRTLAGYSERHHIRPRCMGGTDDPHNLVRLTPEEHYVAHQLLVKIHPEIPTLIFAAQRMTQGRPSNKLYGWIRRRHAAAQKGRTFSAETRQKMRAAKLGKAQPAALVAKRVAKNTGKKRSEQFRLHQASIKTGKQHSTERKANISAAIRRSLANGMKTKPSVLEGRKKQAAALRGRKQSPEQIAKARTAWLASMRKKLEAGESVHPAALPLLADSA